MDNKYYVVKVTKTNNEVEYLLDPSTNDDKFYTEQDALVCWDNNKSNYNSEEISKVIIVKKMIQETEEPVRSLAVTKAEEIFLEIDSIRNNYLAINQGYERIDDLIMNYDCPYEEYDPSEVDIIEKILIGYDDMSIVMNSSVTKCNNFKILSILNDFYFNKVPVRGTYIHSLKNLYFKDFPEPIKKEFRRTELEVKIYNDKAFDENFI